MINVDRSFKCSILVQYFVISFYSLDKRCIQSESRAVNIVGQYKLSFCEKAVPTEMHVLN
jgi:hypothetical protein